QDPGPLLHRLSVVLERRVPVPVRARLADVDQCRLVGRPERHGLRPDALSLSEPHRDAAHGHLRRRRPVGAVGALAARAVPHPIAPAGAAQPALSRLLHRPLALAAPAHAAVTATCGRRGWLIVWFVVRRWPFPLSPDAYLNGEQRTANGQRRQRYF